MQEYDRGRGVLPHDTPYACWLWFHLVECGVWPERFPLAELPVETWLELRHLCSSAVPFRHDYARSLVEIVRSVVKAGG